MCVCEQVCMVYDTNWTVTVADVAPPLCDYLFYTKVLYMCENSDYIHSDCL